VTRPSPRPRPKPKASLGVTTKSDSERLTGVEDSKPAEQKNVTHLGHRFNKSVNPIGFEAATACKSGIGLVSVPEGDDVA
jgi:hypothetical protein